MESDSADDLDARERQLLAAIKELKSANLDSVQKYFTCDKKELVNLLNRLYSRGLVELLQGQKMSFRYIDPDEAAKFVFAVMLLFAHFMSRDNTNEYRTRELSPHEKSVYNLIKSEGTKGIWVKDIKTKTGLHQEVVNNSIKALEKQRLIKSVKSVKNPTRKLYMLSELTPSEELTGGAWYTDNELDVAFISEISKIVYQFIQQRSFPKDGKEDSHYSADYQGYPTTRDIANFIRDRKVVTVDLSIAEVQMVVDMLWYDGRVQRILKTGDDTLLAAIARVEQRKREASGRAARAAKRPRYSSAADTNDVDDALRLMESDGSDANDGDYDDDGGEGTRWMYRALNRGTAGAGTAVGGDIGDSVVAAGRSALSEVPCGGCPVASFCQPGGPVGPATCVYYDRWLEF